jgi:TRAP-type C4-dicarboxylate transport system permease small subunit
VTLAVISAAALAWLLRADLVGDRLLLRLWKTIEVGVGLLLMIGLLYVGTLQILVRYAPAGTLYASWTEELARLMVVWMTFWGAAVVQRSGGHMSVSLLYDALPKGGRKVIRIAGDMVILIVLALLVTEGWRIAYLQIGQTTITLDISIAAFAYAVPVGGSLMLLFVLLDIVARLRGQSTERDGAAGRLG